MKEQLRLLLFILQKTASKSGIVVPQKLKWHGRLAARLIHIAGTGLDATWRMSWDDRSGEFDGSHSGPLIFCTWHNRLALSMTVWNSFVSRRRPEAGLAALISASRDGGLLAKSLSHFGVTAVRGSSSRRGGQALLELTKVIERGYNVAITPDGPRGPKYVLKQGIIGLAQITGRPIIPVGVTISAKKTLRSWDQFQVPLPLARCRVILEKPFVIPREAEELEREKLRVQLEQKMREINPD